jgi:ATP-dependent DNA helicase RecG
VIASVSDAPDVLLNPRQEVALQFLRQVGHVRITNGDLQAMFPSIHPETIRRDLADLVQKGLLLKRGAKRGSYYVLNGGFDK